MAEAVQEALREALRHCPARTWWVAYSGGLDSHVLLHALAGMRKSLGADLRAVHVNHGLQAESGDWADHCIRVCETLGVPLQVVAVQVSTAAGESVEAAAREARYAALADLMDAHHAVLTAHHRDDQAETLLLQMLRGAGPAGTAAMPVCRPLGRGLLCRPLLACSRAALRAYADRHGLTWVDDPSNAATGYDRNYLRHEVFPVLRRRWPATERTLSRVAGLQAEAAELLAVLAGQDLAAVAGPSPDCLSRTRLAALSAARQRNALRYWLQRLGLPLPTAAQLERVQTDVLAARPDAAPCVRWTGAEVRAYRDGLHAMRPLPAPPAGPLPWDMRQELDILGAGRLTARPETGRGVRAACLRTGPVTVRFRRGGEALRLARTRPLKHLLQEAGVPPWERSRLPLIYVGDALVAVADRWVASDYAAGDGEPGVTIQFHPVRA